MEFICVSKLLLLKPPCEQYFYATTGRCRSNVDPRSSRQVKRPGSFCPSNIRLPRCQSAGQGAFGYRGRAEKQRNARSALATRQRHCGMPCFCPQRACLPHEPVSSPLPSALSGRSRSRGRRQGEKMHAFGPLSASQVDLDPLAQRLDAQQRSREIFAASRGESNDPLFCPLAFARRAGAR